MGASILPLVIHYTEHIGTFNAVPSTVKHLYASVIVWTIISKTSVWQYRGVSLFQNVYLAVARYKSQGSCRVK